MKKILSMLLALTMVFALVACGGGDAPAEDGKISTAVEGKLTMATNATFPPYEYYEDGKVVGIDVEIAGAVANKLGLELVVEDMEFDAIVEAVKSGKADLGLAGMTVSPERLEVVNFTVPYATGIQSVIVAEGSSITSVDDLFAEGANHIVGVQRNTTGDIYASDDIEGAGLGTVDRYSKHADAIQALKTGKVDCVIVDNEPAKAFVQEIDGLTLLDTNYAEEDYAACMSKTNQPLYDAVNAALEELIADGTIGGIIEKYIPSK